MDAVRSEPDETTRLLTNQTDETTGSNERGSPIRRQGLLQRQILLLTTVLVLLQLHLIFFSGASGGLKLQQICYEFYKDHKPDKTEPGGKFDPFECYFEEPVLQRLRELLNWDRGISSIVCKSVCKPIRSSR